MSISRIHRLLRLITILQGGRTYTPAELADELEVSRRTVFRDLNMLEMARIPYYFDADSGGYRIGEHFFLPPVNLTLAEALAMLVLTGQIRGLDQIPLLSQGTRAAAKLQSVLPGPIRQHIGNVIGRLSVSLGPTASDAGGEKLFEQFTKAIGERRICHIEYNSFHDRQVVRLEIHPLRLVFHSRAWYLLAFSPHHKQVRTFKVVRVRKLNLASQKFAQRDVDIEKHFGDAWSMIPEGRTYKIHLRFSSSVGPNVAEVLWHRTQKIVTNPDGSLDFHASVDGLNEISWWILGYGDQVEVIAPAALRRKFRTLTENMHGLYQEEPCEV